METEPRIISPAGAGERVRIGIGEGIYILATAFGGRACSKTTHSFKHHPAIPPADAITAPWRGLCPTHKGPSGAS